MSSKLIYRCGRFLDQGYVTLSSSGRSTEDLGLMAAARKEATPGVASYRWDIRSEGRAVTDELFFIHGRALSDRTGAAVQAQLKALADGVLPTILADVKARALAPAATRELLETRLSVEAAQLNTLVTAAPRASSEPATRSAAKAGRARCRSLPALIGVGVLLVALAALSAGFPSLGPQSPQDAPHAAMGPTREEVARVAKACYPDLETSDQVSATLDRLSVALSGEKWDERKEGLLDPLARLGEEQRARLRIPTEGLAQEQVCRQRQAMWEEAKRFSASRGSLKSWATRARTALPEWRRDLPLLKLIDALDEALVRSPLPSSPADCAMGYCLPILHDQDLALITRMNEIRKIITAELSAIRTDSEMQAPLRKAEVILRGELNLAGADIGNPQFPWKCDNDPDCVVGPFEANQWLNDWLTTDVGGDNPATTSSKTAP